MSDGAMCVVFFIVTGNSLLEKRGERGGGDVLFSQRAAREGVRDIRHAIQANGSPLRQSAPFFFPSLDPREANAPLWSDVIPAVSRHLQL